MRKLKKELKGREIRRELKKKLKRESRLVFKCLGLIMLVTFHYVTYKYT